MTSERDATEEISLLKRNTRALWGRGDYSAVAPLLEGAARHLVERCSISHGQDVLDVAAGTGNVAICASGRGARVIACDLNPVLVGKGRERSRAEGFDMGWVEADCEALPFKDRRFDCVTSAFGTMFAPRPAVVVSELFRVARPGATVSLAGWTPESYPGRSGAIARRYLPPSEGIPSPLQWGVEEDVRPRLEPCATSILTERGSVRWEFGSLQEMHELFESNAPLSIATRESLSQDRYEQYSEEVMELTRAFNRAGDGSVVIHAGYLLVVARAR
ncbi:class I SAM-dependent methyltransferase [soil metagenome]